MITSRRCRVRLCIAVAAGLSASVFEMKLARAQQNLNDPTVFLNANDASGVSSFLGGSSYQWATSSDSTRAAGLAPTSGYAYVVTGNANGSGGWLRTPTTGGATFAGNSLTIVPYNGQANLYNTSTSIVNPQDKTAALFLYGANTSGQTITVGNLELANGGAIINSGTTATTLAGTLYLAPAGTTIDGITTAVSGGILDVGGSSAVLLLNATLTGTGQLHIISTSNSTDVAAINVSNASFTGGMLLDDTVGNGAAAGSETAPVLDINNPNALGSGAFTVGSFNPSGVQSTAGILGFGPEIDNTTGSAETLVGTPMVWNGGFQFKGTNALNLGTAGITVASSITLTVDANILSTSGTISGGSTLTVSGAGAFELALPGLINTPITVNSSGGTLAALASAFTPAQIAALPANSNVTFLTGSFLGIDTTGDSGYNLSASLPAGSYGLNKIGAGTLLLSGSNGYTGQTNISTGTLQVGSSSALPSAGNVSIGTGTSLDLNGSSISVGSLLGSGLVTNSTTSPATLTLTTGGTQFTGNISNGSATTSLNVNLAATTGVFNMSSATNSYTGSTTLTSGALFIGASSLTNHDPIVFSGGTLGFSAAPTTDPDPSLTATATGGNPFSFNVASGLNITLGANFSGGSTGLTKLGPGVLTLSGTTSTYGGVTNIAGGTLAVTSAVNLSPNTTIDVAVLSGASTSLSNFLAISNVSNYSIANSITGPGNFQKSGTFMVTLTGNNSYTGSTNISSGTLRVGNATALGSTANIAFGTTTPTPTLDLNGFNASVGSMSGAGSVTNSGATPTVLTITTGGSTAFTGNISNGASSTSLNVNLASSAASFNMSTATSGTLASGYTGSTNLGNGVLFIGANSLKANNPIIFNGGTLGFTTQPTNDPSVNFTAVNGNGFSFNVGGTAYVTLSNGLTDGSNGATSVTMGGTGTLILAGTNTYSGPTAINSGTLAFPTIASLPPGITANGIYVAGTSGSANGAFGIGNNTSNFSFSLPGSGVSGPGALAKIGTDTVTLTGTNNTYTGFTIVNQGTLVLGAANALGSSNVASLGLNAGPTNGTLDLNGFSETLNIIAGGDGGVVTNSNSSAATLTLLPAQASTQFLTGAGSYFGQISGNLSLVINNPATTTVVLGIGSVLNPSNFTGTTNLASGTLSISNPYALPTSTHELNFNGGFLELGAFNQAGATLMDFSSGFSLAPNQQINIAPSGTYLYTFAGSLNSPGGSLTLGNTSINASGTLLLAGANTYSGPTTVNTGTLVIGNPLALAGTSGVTVNATYANPFISGSTSTFSMLQINDSSGSVGLAGGNGAPITLTLAGLGGISNAYVYRTGITNHTAGFEFWGALEGSTGQSDVFAGNIVLNGAGNPVGISGGYANTSGGSLKLTGAISGTGPLVLGLNSNSTTILASANTYSGETQITSTLGTPTTVQLGANAAIPATSGLDFANCNLVDVSSGTFAYAAATLDLHGFSTAAAYVTSSTSTITSYASTYSTTNANQGNGVVTNLQNGSTSTLTILGNPPSGPYLGSYQDGGATAKLALDFDGGVQQMTGTNNYSGGTTIDSGTLIASSLASIGTGNITVNSPGGAIIQNTAAGTIFAKLATGYNGGNWNGSGVNSTSAAADTTHLTAVGMLQPSSPSNFEGQSVNPTDVALKLTYYGDANLDGKVDGSDYSLIDNGYLQGLTGWQNGDFNYDGVINGSDYTLIDNAYNSQGAQFSSELAALTAQIGQPAGTGAVPEPASLGLIGLGAGVLLGRRRRNEIRRSKM